MSDATGLSPFRGKVRGYIIPTTHFKNRPIAKVKTDTSVKFAAEPGSAYKPVPSVSPEIKEVKPNPKEVVKPSLKISNSNLNGVGVSSFSLSSIRIKNEAKRKLAEKITEVNEANTPFTQEALVTLWKKYIDKKLEEGESNIAAILEMSTPELNSPHKILLKSSNSLNRMELQKELTHLLPYLSQTLNNYQITYEISVVRIQNQEVVYDAKEKYEHLKQINPNIEILRKEFDLDI